MCFILTVCSVLIVIAISVCSHCMYFHCVLPLWVFRRRAWVSAPGTRAPRHPAPRHLAPEHTQHPGTRPSSQNRPYPESAGTPTEFTLIGEKWKKKHYQVACGVSEGARHWEIPASKPVAAMTPAGSPTASALASEQGGAAGPRLACR